MKQLFQQQGYTLGTISHQIYHNIFNAYIHGETSLDHVSLFFSTLEGSFFTDLEQVMCVWSDVALIEIMPGFPQNNRLFHAAVG